MKHKKSKTVKNSLSAFTNNKLTSKFLLFFIGLSSLVWFIVRVLPKPQRATYPCMRAAAPWASAFVVYLLGITSASFSFNRMLQAIKQSRFIKVSLFLVLGVFSILLALTQQHRPVLGSSLVSINDQLEDPTTPMGEAKGIYPGRVVWIMDTASTNENCTNQWGDGYFLDKNTNQQVVDEMLEEAVKQLTGAITIEKAWESIFKYHNQQRGKGEVDYVEGEIIFIKINATSAWYGNYNTNDLSRENNENYAIAETSPQLILSVLRQLVNQVGVKQPNIYLGDPMKHIYQDIYEKIYPEFPNVHFLDNSIDGLGREVVQPSASAKIDYSDRGSVLRTGSWDDATVGDPINTDALYAIFNKMDYMINIPTLKAHERGGVTMFAKNHFGSHTRGDAKHLHGGLTRVNGNPDENRDTYKMYRVLTDIMGHELLGGKNLVYLMDALYCAPWEVTQPSKWQKAPWNNDWTSSVLISQDPVAIESVGFDLLYNEYDGSNQHPAYPHYGAVDDYLHQAADKSNWPDGISYDPENDGVQMGSLGVHEHWNNATDMQYSSNLGADGGIELKKVIKTGTSIQPLSVDQTFKVYPNPTSGQITIETESGENVDHVQLINQQGQVVLTLQKQWSAKTTLDISSVQAGIYYLILNNQPQSASKIIKK